VRLTAALAYIPPQAERRKPPLGFFISCMFLYDKKHE